MKKVQVLSDRKQSASGILPEDKDRYARKQRVLNRWRLWYTLIKNPQLRQFRRRLQDGEHQEGSWAVYSKKERKRLRKALLARAASLHKDGTPLSVYESSEGKSEYRLYRDEDDDISESSTSSSSEEHVAI